MFGFFKLSFLRFSLALFLLAGFYSLVQAATVKQDRIIIDKDQVISDTYYAATHDFIVEGEITGEVVAVADTVTIRGVLEDGLIVAAQELIIEGEVRGNLRAVCVICRINGLIDGDATIMTSQLILSSSSQVTGDLYYFSTTAAINGVVEGEQKDLSAWLIRRPTTQELLYSFFQSFLAFALIGVLFYSIQPYIYTEQLFRLTGKGIGISFLIGLASLLLGLPIVLLLTLSSIGRWVGLFLLLGGVLVGLLAMVDSGYCAGRLLIFRRMYSPKMIIPCFAIGIFILILLAQFPWLWLFPLVIWCVAFGARTRLYYQQVRTWKELTP